MVKLSRPKHVFETDMTDMIWGSHFCFYSFEFNNLTNCASKKWHIFCLISHSRSVSPIMRGKKIRENVESEGLGVALWSCCVDVSIWRWAQILSLYITCYCWVFSVLGLCVFVYVSLREESLLLAQRCSFPLSSRVKALRPSLGEASTIWIAKKTENPLQAES